MMPNLDGPSTVEKIHASKENALIPIIIMTARSLEEEDLQDRLNGKIIAHILKPFDPLKLPQEIKEIWENHKKKNENHERS